RRPFVRDLAASFGPADWNVCTDATRMRNVLSHLAIPIPMRKLRLGACYVCRTEFDWCRNPRFLEAVSVGEAFSDGRATEADRAEAYSSLRDLPHQMSHPDRWWSMGLWCVSPEEWLARQRSGLPSLVLPPDWYREAFGNPLAPVRFDPEWRTSTA